MKTSEVSENPGGLEEGLEALSQQELLVAGALRPAHLLDLLHNFTLFDRGGGRIKKIVPRYQQFRAVHKAVEQLQQGATRAEDGEYDRRGGIIWHTQGSGKSLSMVFLIRKMRALPDLRRFKIVLITDRTKLEEQLAETAALTGEPLQIADSITDFLELLRQPGAGLVFGLADHLHEALEIYTRNDIHGALRPIADEVPKLRDRHARVVELFTGHGCDLLDTEGCVELLRDARLRARFIVTLREFLETLDFVLPRPEALPYVRDAQQLGLIRLRTTRRYRDQHLDIAGAEAKVRRLIDAYVVAQGVDPRIPPLDILDAEFEAHVGRLRSPRAQAAEMEFAARHHIRRHLQEDPVYYQKLSERLEEILQRFADNWEAQVEALRDLLRDYRQTQAEMSQEEQAVRPFLRLLVAAQEEREPTAERRRALAAAAVGLVEEIRREIARVDFWRKPVAQERLRATILRYLDNHDLVPFERQEALADQLLQTARANHSRLVE
ncbi:MAG: type I restriction enzyme endonuclease domain-containing protein [Anaerolineales bacterium]